MFRVDYLLSVLNDLTAIWTEADSVARQAITTASHQIDYQLERDPENVGESRPSGRRVLFALPLGVLYRVDLNKQIVTLIDIWLVRQRANP
jgi:hypothetical protein